MGRNIVDIKNIKLHDSKDIDYPEVRVRAVSQSSTFLDKQFFHSVKSPNIDSRPFSEHRVKAFYNDDESDWLFNKSLLTDNIHYGLNEFRIRGVSKDGKNSDYLQDNIFVGEDGVSRIYLAFLFDVMQNYFNDYLSEVFLTHTFKEDFDVIDIVDEVVSDVFLTHERSKTDHFYFEMKELFELCFGEILEKEELFDVDLLERGIIYFSHFVGYDKIEFDDFISLIEQFLEVLLEDELINQVENYSESISVDLDGDKELKVVEQIKDLLADEVLKCYNEFRKEDLALLTFKEIIDDLFIIKQERDNIYIDFNEDVDLRDFDSVDKETQIKMMFKEIVDVGPFVTETFKELAQIDATSHPAFIWKATLQDLIKQDIIEHCGGITDNRLKITQSDKLKFPQNQTASAILYNDNNEPELLIGKELYEPVEKELVKNDIAQDLEESQQVLEKMAFAEFVEVLKFFGPLRVENILIDFKEIIKVKNAIFPLEIITDNNVEFLEDFRYWRHEYLKEHSNIRELAYFGEDVNYEITDILIDSHDFFHFEYSGSESESIVIEFNERLGMPGKDAASIMGLVSLGYYPLGEKVE